MQGNTKDPAQAAASEWKIDGDQPTTMHLTAKAAIRYVTEKRAKTTDPEIRKNADQAIAKLMPYR
jgi:hypothetical protein